MARERGEPSQPPIPLPRELDNDPFVQAFDTALARRQAEGKVTLPISDAEKSACRILMHRYGQEMHEKFDLGMEHIYRPYWLDTPLQDWLALKPLERHIVIEEDRAWYLAHAWREELAVIPPGDCLDIGIGSGFFLRTMQAEDAHHTWHGIDLPNASLPTNGTPLDRKQIPHFQEYDGRAMPPEWTGKFSGLTLHNVMHHLHPTKREAFFEELYRIAKPGARIIVTEEMGFGLKLKEGTQGIRAYTNHVLDAALEILDACFYPLEEKGWQRASVEWQAMFDHYGFTSVCSGDNGVFNPAGLPVAETYLVFERRPDEKKHEMAYTYRGRKNVLAEYGLDSETEN